MLSTILMSQRNQPNLERERHTDQERSWIERLLELADKLLRSESEPSENPPSEDKDDKAA